MNEEQLWKQLNEECNDNEQPFIPLNRATKKKARIRERRAIICGKEPFPVEKIDALNPDIKDAANELYRLASNQNKILDKITTDIETVDELLRISPLKPPLKMKVKITVPDFGTWTQISVTDFLIGYPDKTQQMCSVYIEYSYIDRENPDHIVETVVRRLKEDKVPVRIAAHKYLNKYIMFVNDHLKQQEI